MWAWDLLISLLAIVSFFQMGLLVDYYLLNHRRLHFNLAVFLGLGLGFCAILQMLLAVLAVPISDFAVRGFTAVLFLPYIFDSNFRRQAAGFLRSLGKSRKVGIIVPVLVLLAFISVILVITFSHPVWGYDGIQRWLLKARLFWADGIITKANLALVQPADDPNLWPLSGTWFYHLLGRSDDFWIQFIPVTVLVCLAADFWRIVKTSGKVSWLWTAILLFCPFLWQTASSEAYSGNADLLVSFYLFLAFSRLFNKQFVYAAIFLGLGALTKNDALPALAGFCVLLPIFYRGGKFNLSKLALAVAAAFLIFNVSWKLYFGMNSRYLQTDWSVIFRQRPIFGYTKYTLQGFREQFRQIDRWGVGFLVIGFFVLTRIRRIFNDRRLLFVGVLFGAQLLGYIWVYYVTSEDQATQIATSLFRLVSQIFPSLLIFAYTLSVTNVEGLKLKDGKK